MAAFEVNSRVTHRSLMNRSKHELASRVLELMDLLDRERTRRPEGRVTLASVELRNLLEVSWRDGNSLPERLHDEWPEKMRENVDRTIAEIDRWKVEGVPNDLYPEESRCPCGMPYADCLEGSVRGRDLTEEECPRYGS